MRSTRRRARARSSPRSASSRAAARERVVEPRGRRRAARPTSSKNASSAAGSRGQRAQHVEAMTLPEPSQIELSGPRGTAAAGPTPRRSRCRPGTRGPRPRAAGALAVQYLMTARREPRGTPLVRRRRVGVRRAGQAQQRGRWPPPTRAPDRPARCASAAGRSSVRAERAAGAGVVRRPARRLRIDGRRADARSRAGSWLTISMMVRDAAALVADPPGAACRRTRSRATRWTGCRACP